VIGLVIFAIGVATGNARAWQAWHVNWLYFTSISSAGVVLVAVQRITTARWARGAIRIVEGYVAFLPVAFVMLLLTILLGKGHIFSFVHEPPVVPEKHAWLNTGVWSRRDIVTFGVSATLSVCSVYTSVRLDVGILPEWGASWAKGLRDR